MSKAERVVSLLRALPTALTLSRVILGPLFLVLYRQGVNVWWLVALVIVASLTDYFDGATARRWKIVSSGGKLLDPLADAFFCMIIFVDFAVHGLVWPWIVWVLVAREVFVTFILRPLALYHGIVVAAGALGKAKTVCQFTAIFVVLATMLPGFPLKPPVLEALKVTAFLAAAVLSVTSAVQYAWHVFGGLKRGRNGTVGSIPPAESR